MKTKLTIIFALAVFPLIAHIATGFYYAYGGYDGKHCAGLLDAVWKCNIFEYYFDYIFGFFGISSLIMFYAIAAIPYSFIAIFYIMSTLFKTKLTNEI